jgi:hypothetical protein
MGRHAVDQWNIAPTLIQTSTTTPEMIKPAGIDAIAHFSMKTTIEDIGMSKSTTTTRIGAERPARALRGESLGSPMTLIGIGSGARLVKR